MIPFYIYYSMFGFQRVGDLAWAAGDMRARGFLIGGTAGRTTLNGEGLQHEDGHSHLLVGTIPNCVSYDPTFAYEVAVIIQDGLRRMYAEQEDVFYYITRDERELRAPGDAGGRRGGHPQGHVPAARSGRRRTAKAARRGCSCWAAARSCARCIAAADLLAEDFGVAADVWSATSFTELRRDGLAAERWNLLHPTRDRRAELRRDVPGRPPAARWSRRPTTCGRSPTRSGPTCRAATACSAPTASAAPTTARKLRHFFEVDRHWVARGGAECAGRGRRGRPPTRSPRRSSRYGIDPEKPDPARS